MAGAIVLRGWRKGARTDHESSQRNGSPIPKEVASDRYSGRVIGDKVEVIVDAGTGATRTFEIAATRAGRRVEVTTARGVVEVAELTRTGQPVRVGRFMATRVIAIVEHPASDGAVGTERRRSTRVEQEETLL
jgi:hypothetical protein